MTAEVVQIVVGQALVFGVPALLWGGSTHRTVRDHSAWIHQADSIGTAASRVIAANVTADARTLEQLAQTLVEHAATMARLTEELNDAKVRLAEVETRCAIFHPGRRE